MKAIETTATVDADLGHLTLSQPLPNRPDGEVKVIVLFDEQPATVSAKDVDYTQAIGGMYRLFPNAPHMSTAEWMTTIREGSDVWHPRWRWNGTKPDRSDSC